MTRVVVPLFKKGHQTVCSNSLSSSDLTIKAGTCFALAALSQTCFQCMLDPGRGALYHHSFFIIFMHMIFRHSWGREGVQFGKHRISLLVFVNDVFLLASFNVEPQHALEQFSGEREATENQHTITNTVKSGTMVFPQKKLAYHLDIRGESLP